MELPPGTGDEEYLAKLSAGLDAAAAAFPQPDLLLYNAGSDILRGDPLGRLAVSAQGVTARDAAVWRFAAAHRVPIAMLLSGGYSREGAAVVAASLAALLRAIEV